MVLYYKRVHFYGIFLKKNKEQKKDYIFRFTKVFMTRNVVTLLTNLISRLDMSTNYKQRGLMIPYLILRKKLIS